MRMPTLLIYGSQDKATPIKSVCEQLHQKIADSKLIIIDGADHIVHQTDSEKVNTTTREFLK